ncbi:MATE family efflux transporter [Pseudomonas sp. GL-B-26]|uniref:MATE family efflux transporter n=1 Tax=Pseudomonas sp. GL-B-26 TaxID=2832394 RepID=UPI001CBB4F80|nr:MATE family efflux transporter [Pseudomonas sp. GL-B-26]
MDVARISVPLIFSRLGEMVASLFCFVFVGHFIVGSLSLASLAWALVSFLTVVGIGFFSILLVKVAGSNDLNADDIEHNLNISFRCAIFFGVVIVVGVFLYVVSATNSLGANDGLPGFEVLLIFSFSIPALYVQLVIFNFFNAVKQAHYELLYTWLFNIVVVLMGALLVLMELDSNVICFVSAYVALRWFFVVLAFILFDRRIRLYIYRFRYRRNISNKMYVDYFLNGLPLALCFGGESFLFFTLSFVSKSIGDSSLSAYQASLHFLSIVYMVSIGVGNATGIVTARHYRLKDFPSLRRTYIQGMKFGFFMLAPFLLACFFLKEYISLIYTSDELVRRLIESNVLISIPFLVFEYIYVVTRMTLRSLGDFWMPTLFTISLLNVLGLVLSVGLLSFYDYSVSSIFIALVLCSFFLMLFLLLRLGRILKVHEQRSLSASLCG